MAYIGYTGALGNIQKIDNITFNSSSTTFDIRVAGLLVPVAASTSLFISVSGVIQEPNVDFFVSGSSIIFSVAPVTGLSFFGIILGASINIGSPSDGTVTNVKIGETISIAKGGTGGTTADTALNNLGAGAAGKAVFASVTQANARTQLGLGTSAVLDVGTSTGNVVQLVTGNKLPAVDGSNLTGISSGFVGFANFTTVGTTNWTVPAGVTKVKITAVGGGGGGRSANGDGVIATQGAGGGSGCVVSGYVTGLTPGSTVVVTVGAAGTVGGNGGDTSFGTFIIGGGGKSGVVGGTGIANPGGLVGTASGSVTNLTTLPFKAVSGQGGAVADSSNSYLNSTAGGTNTFSTYGTGGFGGGARSQGYQAYGGGPGTQGCLLIEF